jgi:hypothetical protein
MTGLIYLVQGEEQLVAMTEQAYDSEDLLQRLLATYPSLLAGDQVDSTNPRLWLLVSREIGLASEEAGDDRWSIDHLFLDQDAIPTIVEVKRSSDTRIRREVVGQMLDYAANAVVYWPVEAIRAQFERYYEMQELDPEQVFVETFGQDMDQERFWLSVKTNLQAGRVRLVFVADTIPVELRRIVEYLNEQMSPTDVIGIEIKQYVGQGVQALVPRVVGNMAQPRPGETLQIGQWSAETFDHALFAARGESAVLIARRIRAWAESRSMRLWWGKGKQSGSCYLMVDHNGVQHWTVALWTTGQVAVQFGSMMTNPPFHSESLRLELLERLNQIPGVSIDQDRISKYPSFQITLLSEPESLRQFLAALDWALSQIRR